MLQFNSLLPNAVCNCHGFEDPVLGCQILSQVTVKYIDATGHIVTLGEMTICANCFSLWLDDYKCTRL